jgi:OHCU decarboxylase
MAITVSELNACPTAHFVSVCGPFYERSPWIAERTAVGRPYKSREELLHGFSATVECASADEQLALIRSHPDLVGSATQKSELTVESAREQAAAGLGALNADEVRRFRELNAAYWDKFGFPFIICARENKKEAILAAFPARLESTREQERHTALEEIAKIARLRLFDTLGEG